MTFSAPAAEAAALRAALLADRTAALTRLYGQVFPAVRRHVRRHGGTLSDAPDVFHDALVIFYEKVVAETLPPGIAPAAYLLGISRHLWQRELHRRHQLPAAELPPDVADALADEAADAALAEAKEAHLRHHLAALGERCRDILTAFYYFQQPLTQIAARHAYATVRSATVQKYKCLKRLRDAVKGVRDTLTSHADAR